MISKYIDFRISDIKTSFDSNFDRQVIFNSAMALIMEHFREPKRSEHLGLAVGLGSLAEKIHMFCKTENPKRWAFPKIWENPPNHP